MKNQENTPQNNSIWEKAVKSHKEKTKGNNRPEWFNSERYKAAVRAANLKQTPKK